MSPVVLYQFEPRVRAALVAALQARGLPAVYDALSPEEAPPELVVIEASPFNRASTHMDFAKNGRPFFNHYLGQVRFIITTRRMAAAARALHATCLGHARALMDCAAPGFAVEGYRFLRLEETSGSITYISDRERDRSELEFDVELSIPGAFMDYAATTL